MTSQTTYNEVDKIWQGSKIEPQYGKSNSLGSEVLKALRKEPENIAQISYPSGKEYKNREILLLSIRIAQHLEKLNLPQCEVVGLCASNSEFVAPLFFACQYRGLIVSTLDPSFDKDGIKHIYSITKPKLMFCDGLIYHNVRMAFDECGLASTTIYTMKDHIEGVPRIDDFLEETQREDEFECAEKLKMGSNQVAVIVCSSGTTGLPKGVCISHTALLNGMGLMPPGPHRNLCFSTLYWGSGLFNLLATTLGDNYTRIITDKPFDAEECLKIIKRYEITMFIGPPSQLGLLLACPQLQQNYIQSLQMLLFIGSALPQSLVTKLQKYLPDVLIVCGYGQTEAAGGISAGLAFEEGNCGQIAINVEVKIIDNCNQNLGPGEIGEICSRSLYPWAGYYGNPEVTATVYDSERWIHSGDLGYVDDRGNLFVIDRKKDILKYNNFHFYPTEIENVILELPDVVEVCVCGIPDEIFSNLPAAAIVKVPGSNLTENMVYQHVADRMVHFKHLRGGVYFVDELIKTPSGKVVRRKVSELCQNLYNSAVEKGKSELSPPTMNSKY